MENSKAVAAKTQPSFKEYLQKTEKQITAIMAKGVDPKKYIQAAAFSISKMPKVLECTSISIINCVMEASQLGLNIGGVRGECYIVPYNDRKNNKMVAQFILGYQGMLSLLFKTGKIKSIQVKEVYENDTFSFEYGSRAFLMHQPLMDGDRGAFKAVYAIIELTTGGTIFEVMPKVDIDRARDMSQDYKYKKEDSIWGKFYPEMAKKTVVRRIFKYLPLSSDIQRAVNLDEQADSGMQEIDLIENDGIFEVDDKSKSDRLADKIDSQAVNQ
jgi:recombination protein RecT